MTQPKRSAEARYHAGLQARDAGDLQAAERLLREAWRADPTWPVAANGLATVLLAQGRVERAEQILRAGLRLAPEAAPLLFNLGLALLRRRHYSGAADAFRAALQDAPAMVGALANLGYALRHLGELDAAEEAFRRALAISPENPAAAYGLAMLLLATGRWAEGWALYERRIDLLDLPRLTLPVWDGTKLAGRTLLVQGEQGYGDTIQFARFVPMLAERDGLAERPTEPGRSEPGRSDPGRSEPGRSEPGGIVLRVRPPLVRLLRSLDRRITVVADDKPPPPADVGVLVMSLAQRLGITPERAAPTIPYLRAEAGEVAAWRARLAALPRPWVGLAWEGSGGFEEHAAKLVPPAALAPLLRVPAGFVSLQVGGTSGRPRAPRGGVLADWTSELHDFAATAALVTCLDVVVTVDTAVAHLAGALGRAVWLLERHDGCWRWRGTPASPWYETVEIIRQSTPGDWTNALDYLRDRLNNTQRAIVSGTSATDL